MVLALTTQQGAAGGRIEVIVSSGETLPLLAVDVVPEGQLTTLARVVANNRSGQVVPDSSLNVTLTNWTEAVDTAAAFDPVAGLFTAPADGFYQVNTSIIATSNVASYSIAVLVNNVARLQPGGLAGGQTTLGGLVQMAKGDVLRVGLTNFSGASVTLFNNAGAPGENNLSITQQP